VAYFKNISKNFLSPKIAFKMHCAQNSQFVGSSLVLTSRWSYHMLFLAPRAPRWAPFLRTGSNHG